MADYVEHAADARTQVQRPIPNLHPGENRQFFVADLAVGVALSFLTFWLNKLLSPFSGNLPTSSRILSLAFALNTFPNHKNLPGDLLVDPRSIHRFFCGRVGKAQQEARTAAVRPILFLKRRRRQGAYSSGDSHSIERRRHFERLSVFGRARLVSGRTRILKPFSMV